MLQSQWAKPNHWDFSIPPPSHAAIAVGQTKSLRFQQISPTPHAVIAVGQTKPLTFQQIHPSTTCSNRSGPNQTAKISVNPSSPTRYICSHSSKLSLNAAPSPSWVWLKGHGNEADFLGFCRNWFLIDPLHYLSSRSEFGFEFAEIFVIDKRFPNSASPGVGNSPTQRVGESAFECLKENRRVKESASRGVTMVSQGVAIRICKKFSAL